MYYRTHFFARSPSGASLDQYLEQLNKSEAASDFMAKSVINAIVTLGSVEELAEHRHQLGKALQPIFAEAMTATLEVLQETLQIPTPNPEEMAEAQKLAQEAMGDITQVAMKGQVPSILEPIITEKWNERFKENPTLGMLVFSILKNYGAFDWVGSVASNVLGGVSPKGSSTTPTKSSGGW